MTGAMKIKLPDACTYTRRIVEVSVPAAIATLMFASSFIPTCRTGDACSWSAAASW